MFTFTLFLIQPDESAHLELMVHFHPLQALALVRTKRKRDDVLRKQRGAGSKVRFVAIANNAAQRLKLRTIGARLLGQVR